MEIDINQIKSKDPDILEKSIAIINEQLDKETKRGELAEKRAGMLIPFITIGSTFILAFGKLISLENPLTITVVAFFIVTLIFFVKAALFTLISFRIVQANRLTPQLINDIQQFDKLEAMAYEIKWKIWEYNKMVPVNTKRLFYTYRAQNNLMLAVFSILIIACIQFFSCFVTSHSASLVNIQFIAGNITIILGLVSDFIIERFSFWEKE